MLIKHSKTLNAAELQDLDEPSTWLARHGFDPRLPVEMAWDPSTGAAEFSQTVERNPTEAAGPAKAEPAPSDRLLDALAESIMALDDGHRVVMLEAAIALREEQDGGRRVSAAILGQDHAAGPKNETSDAEAAAIEAEFEEEFEFERRVAALEVAASIYRAGLQQGVGAPIASLITTAGTFERFLRDGEAGPRKAA